jgi:prephenate dehydrogenase
MLGRVTVVGCGLIGGSIIKGLRARRQAEHLGAIDRTQVLEAAAAFIDAGAVIGSNEAHALVARADLVVLAAPVSSITNGLGWALDTIADSGVVTDTASAKAAIAGAARGHRRIRRLVPGHPMAGRETAGFEASSAALFEGARWFFVAGPGETSLDEARPDADAVSRVRDLATALGALPTSIDAAAHDRAMSFVSHVPHLVASAVFEAAARAGVLGEAGPGFRDVTRIAGAPVSVWRDIFHANRDEIGRALGDVLVPLIELRDKLVGGDADAVQAAADLLDRAHQSRLAMGTAPPRPPRT